MIALASAGAERRRLLELAAGNVFRAHGSPRRRAADIAIGVTAASLDAAVTLTGNAEDFDGIPGLEVEVVG